jgi:membrane protease YdiL (CAAX protease family)/ABC-type Na+ efflux pump permease subunit
MMGNEPPGSDHRTAPGDGRAAPDAITPSPGYLLAPSSRPPVGQRLARLGRLARKELSEILRDRRTIFTLVLMPLLLYPLLAMAFPQFLVGLRGESRAEVRIGLAVPLDDLPEWRWPRRAQNIKEFIEERLGWGTKGPAMHLTGAVGAPAGGGGFAAVPALLTWREAGFSVLPLPPQFDPLQPGGRPLPQLKFLEVDDLNTALATGKLDVVIRLHRVATPPTRPQRDWEVISTRGFVQFVRVADAARPRLDWELIYREDSPRAKEAVTLLERLCLATSSEWLQHRLWRHGDTRPIPPVRVLRRPVPEKAGELGLSLTAVVPLILILMTITGAVYPAIDLTAGERERGTLDILVAAPVPRLALLFAKYVAVVTVAVLTATVNLVMMTVTLQVSGLAAALSSDLELTAGTVLLVFGLLLLFAAFFAAVLLVLTSFARSFKEAQAYLIPLMLLALAPGLLGLILPRDSLKGVFAVTPLLNIVLLARDLLGGRAELGPALIVVFSTLVYALAALAGAARIFGAESVLYSEQGAWADLVRRPTQPSAAATPAGALLGLAVLFPLSFVLNSVIARAGAGEREGLQVLVTLLLFAALPLLGAAWSRLRLRSAFGLRAAPWPAFLGAVLLGVALVPLVVEFLLLLRALGLTFLSAEQEQALLSQVRETRGLPPAFIAGGMVLIGAAEELFFRGCLFSALRRAAGARTAVVGSAVLFGLFHFVPFDRLIPSTLLGLLLGWVCWRTGSVLPGMVLHACYNALFMLLVYYRVGPEGDAHLPLEWLAAGLAGAAVGAVLIRRGKPAAEAEPAGAGEPATGDLPALARHS